MTNSPSSTKEDQPRQHKNTQENKRQAIKINRKIQKHRKNLINKIQKDIVAHKINQQKDLWSIIKTCNREIHDETSDNPIEQQIDNNNNNQIAEEKFPQITRTSPKLINTILTNNYNNNINQWNNNKHTQPTTYVTPNDQELELAIKEVNNKKHSGPLGLKFQTFNAAMPHIKHNIETICKMSFKTNTIPERYQHTIGLLITKKQPGKYRIVHVATPAQ